MKTKCGIECDNGLCPSCGANVWATFVGAKVGGTIERAVIDCRACGFTLSDRVESWSSETPKSGMDHRKLEELADWLARTGPVYVHEHLRQSVYVDPSSDVKSSSVYLREVGRFYEAALALRELSALLGVAPDKGR